MRVREGHSPRERRHANAKVVAGSSRGPGGQPERGSARARAELAELGVNPLIVDAFHDSNPKAAGAVDAALMANT